MEQIRAEVAILHKDNIHPIGHIFKIPDDMNLETAQKLVDKGICTDTIEVVDEAEVETVAPDEAPAEEVVESTEGTDEHQEAEDGDAGDGEEPEAADETEPEAEGIAIEDLDKDQLKEECTARGIEFHIATGEKKLRAKLLDHMEENPDWTSED